MPHLDDFGPASAGNSRVPSLGEASSDLRAGAWEGWIEEKKDQVTLSCASALYIGFTGFSSKPTYVQKTAEVVRHAAAMQVVRKMSKDLAPCQMRRWLLFCDHGGYTTFSYSISCTSGALNLKSHVRLAHSLP